MAKILGLYIFLISAILFSLSIRTSYSQLSDSPIGNQQLVGYQKESNFIHEFNVPLDSKKGLKGVTTDTQGNAWFYYQNNAQSKLMKFTLENMYFNTHSIKSKTIADIPVITSGFIITKTDDYHYNSSY